VEIFTRPQEGCKRLGIQVVAISDARPSRDHINDCAKRVIRYTIRSPVNLIMSVFLLIAG
jgi:hypothetical protein